MSVGYRIVFDKPKEVSFKDFKVRKCNGNEVKVKVLYTLISNGTEKQNLRGLRPNYPFIPGYSSVGYVCDIGKDIDPDILTFGDRVFVIRGGHQSYNIATLNHIIKIPNELDFITACFARMVSFPMTGLRRSNIQMGENIVIVGLGMLGLFGVQLARLMNPYCLIAIGNREKRRELALKYGADFTLDPKDNECLSKIKDIFTENSIKNTADVVLETSGQFDALKLAFKYTSTRGRIILNGMNSKSDSLSLFDCFNKGISIIGSSSVSRLTNNSYFNNYTEKYDVKFALKLLKEKKINVSNLGFEIFNPKDAKEIYRRLDEDYEFPLAVVLDWTKVGD